MPKEARRPNSDQTAGFEFGGTTRCNWGSEPGLYVHEEAGCSGPTDLLERTARFGEAILRLAKVIPSSPSNNRLIDQLVGAGTSVGANYCEADDAVSAKDYRNKIGICRKESKEAMFFLRMLATAELSLTEEARRLWREAREPNLIFGSIWRKKS